ncbi:MAG: YfhO family protein [Bacteroidales bacterium]|nr:YfhO family protein [Bacteroidales bacterium]
MTVSINKDKFLQWLRNPQVWGFFLSMAVMAIISVAFFSPNNFNGDSLSQHDMQQGTANGEEARAYVEQTGDKALWTNSLFSGMPTFQIAPEYPSNSLFTWLGKVYGLGLPAPSNLLFMMMMGMLIMCYCLKMRWWYALIAAVGWGLSSYFVILIGAGHIWKFLALTYVPPTIGAVIMAYRGRWLAGSSLLALFAMLELNANHPQITYYSLFIIITLAVAFLVHAILNRGIKGWLTASAACLVGGLLAVGANAPSLYNTYEYSKETKRAGSELTQTVGEAEASVQDSEERPTGGLPKEEIGGWSNTPSETFALLVPNLKGGATIRPEKGQNEYLVLGDIASDEALSNDEYGLTANFPQYFGGKGLTNGPFYLGALMVALFLLGAFIVKGPVKWAFVIVTLFSILLAMGNHFEALTDFMIYNVPMYNKFRAAETALVIAALCVPALGALGLQKLFNTPGAIKKYPLELSLALGIPMLIAILAWIAPAIYGNPFSAEELTMIETFKAQVTASQPENLPILMESLDTVRDVRLGMVSADGFRSVMVLLFGGGFVIMGAIRQKYAWLGALGVGTVVLVDLYSVDKRYVSEDSFLPADSYEHADPLAADDFDKAILEDKGYYRVDDLTAFGDARRSFRHHMVGGYHAAKLNRYNDLITRRMAAVNQFGYVPEVRDSLARAGYPQEYQQFFDELLADYHVLDMLNTKYIINHPRQEGGMPELVRNEHALGAAWLVDSVGYVDNADAEMDALATIDPSAYAVADKRFRNALGEGVPSLVAGDTIIMTEYTPNRLTYSTDTRNDAIAVFSEIWFPWGWKATVDGKPAQLARVNYVLRAMRLPAGKHTVVMTFDPDSLHVSGSVAYACVTIIYLLVTLALFSAVTGFGGKGKK